MARLARRAIYVASWRWRGTLAGCCAELCCGHHQIIFIGCVWMDAHAAMRLYVLACECYSAEVH